MAHNKEESMTNEQVKEFKSYLEERAENAKETAKSFRSRKSEKMARFCDGEAHALFLALLEFNKFN